MKDKKTFAEKHPKLNVLLGLTLLIIICVSCIWTANWAIRMLGEGLIAINNYLIEFVDSTDQVIVVAMITGIVSIIGVVISSIVAKIVEYKYNVKKYLYDKREEPYKQFIEMIYRIMEDTKKNEKEKMSEEDMVKMVSKFSKGLTLWGSNRVVKKWLKYRKTSINGDTSELLLQMEDIIYEIRKDVGVGKRLGKGDMLSFFINDVENLKNRRNT